MLNVQKALMGEYRRKAAIIGMAIREIQGKGKRCGVAFEVKSANRKDPRARGKIRHIVAFQFCLDGGRYVVSFHVAEGDVSRAVVYGRHKYKIRIGPHKYHNIVAAKRIARYLREVRRGD
jgi:hypothetical protein